MKRRGTGERPLQPCLLDRLQDESPALELAQSRLHRYQEEREGLAREGRPVPAELERRVFDALSDARDLQERVTRTIFTERHLRESVLRDLTSLLATTALESVQNLDEHPQTRRSVINFGVRGLTGGLATGLSKGGLQIAIRDAILAFEPRILPATLEVTVTETDNDERNRLAIEIVGDVWGHEYPQTLYIRSLLDVETGDVQLAQSVAA